MNYNKNDILVLFWVKNVIIGIISILNREFLCFVENI